MATDTDHMIRVLATHWEAEEYTECWCRDRASAERIARLLKSAAGDSSVQVDAPKKGGK